MEDGKGFRDPARFNAFTDGVMVVSMTLLILNVELPDAVKDLDGAALFQALADIWPNLFAYLLSFLVIAQYWIGYTDQFGGLRRIDGGFAWLNIFFLLAVGFIPFVTNLMGDNDGHLSTQLYAATMVLVSLLLAAMCAYATRKNLVDPPDTRPLVQQLAPSLKTAVVFGVSIVVAQFDFGIAKLTWLLMLLPDGWIIWPARRKAT